MRALTPTLSLTLAPSARASARASIAPPPCRRPPGEIQGEIWGRNRRDVEEILGDKGKLLRLAGAVKD